MGLLRSFWQISFSSMCACLSPDRLAGACSSCSQSQLACICNLLLKAIKSKKKACICSHEAAAYAHRSEA